MTTTSLEPIVDTEIAERMIAVIDAEVTLQEEHLHILMLQKDALISCDRTQFASLHDRFEKLVDKLERHAKKRSNDLPTSAEELSDEMNTWPDELRERAMAAITRLREIAELIGTQAPQNQALINNDLRIVTFGLNLMLEAAGKGPHYGHDGAQSPNNGNRLLNRVA